MSEIENTALTTQLAVVQKDGDLPKKKGAKRVKKVKERKTNTAGENFNAFYELALILNTTEDEVLEQAVLYHINKITSRLKKVLVRYNVNDAEVEKIYLNANALKLGGLCVAPIYLPMCAKQAKKHTLHSIPVCSVIDFPFGESSFKGKLSNVKDSYKIGADEFSVAMPSILFNDEHAKELKKQIKKLGNLYQETAGVIINASDLSDEKIKFAIKVVSKSKLGSITFAFGQATLTEVNEKLSIINKHRCDKKICVLANADGIEAVSQLLKQNVDYILTPYADQIGKDLIEKFKIKSVKLK